MSGGATLELRLAQDVRAAARGDEAAFTRLVGATSTTVTSIALAIVRDVEVSREIAQDVYLAAWRDLARLRDAHSFLPWIRQVTRNRAHHVLRSRIRERRRLEAGDPDAVLAAAADPAPGALDRLVADERRREVERAIAALPPSAREAVVLYYREGRSTRQVADLLGIGEEAVRQRLARARGKLRKPLMAQLRDSAPTAAFTGAVMAALSLAAPSAAAAATLSLGKAAGGKLTGAAGASGIAAPLAVTGAALTGALAGLAGGWAGVLFGARSLLREARDEIERAAIVRFTAVHLLLPLGFIAVVLRWPRPLPVTLAFAVMFGAFGVLHFLWLPRILRRRLEAERREDPVRAEARERIRRRNARVGYLLGGVLGGAAVAASWFF